MALWFTRRSNIFFRVILSRRLNYTNHAHRLIIFWSVSRSAVTYFYQQRGFPFFSYPLLTDEGILEQRDRNCKWSCQLLNNCNVYPVWTVSFKSSVLKSNKTLSCASKIFGVFSIWIVSRVPWLSWISSGRQNVLLNVPSRKFSSSDSVKHKNLSGRFRPAIKFLNVFLNREQASQD